MATVIKICFWDRGLLVDLDLDDWCVWSNDICLLRQLNFIFWHQSQNQYFKQKTEVFLLTIKILDWGIEIQIPDR